MVLMRKMKINAVVKKAKQDQTCNVCRVCRKKTVTIRAMKPLAVKGCIPPARIPYPALLFSL